MTETINPDIFREYDIRGLVDKDLTRDSTERIGKGIGPIFVEVVGEPLRLDMT